jgi:hypothetical protein
VATNKDDAIAAAFGRGALNRQAGVVPWARKNPRLANSVRPGRRGLAGTTNDVMYRLVDNDTDAALELRSE